MLLRSRKFSPHDRDQAKLDTDKRQLTLPHDVQLYQDEAAADDARIEGYGRGKSTSSSTTNEKSSRGVKMVEGMQTRPGMHVQCFNLHNTHFLSSLTMDSLT